MIIIVQSAVILLVVGTLFKIFGQGSKTVLLVGYSVALMTILIYNGLTYGWPSLGKVPDSSTVILGLILVAIVALVFSILDFMVFTIVTQRLLLVDFKYLLSGRLIFDRFLISSAVGLLEEGFFRYYTLELLGFRLPALLLGSALFGLVHGVFSRYDAASKTVLGLLCGLIYMTSGSLIFAIFFHTAYNLFVARERKVERGMNAEYQY